MNNITNSEKGHEEKIGTISVSIYKNSETGLSSFRLNPENDNVVQISYVIEDILKLF